VTTYLLKKASITGAFFICGLLFWQTAAHAAETVRVSHVVDGDSLRLIDGRSVRLIGINAPELARESRAAEPLSKNAHKALTKLVAGKKLELKPGQQAFDHYGRTLAYLVLPDGSFAGEVLLRSGLASLIAIPPNIDHISRYQKTESEARQRRLGIWDHDHYLTVAATYLTPNQTGYRFVQGRIQRVGQSSKYVYFDLAPLFSIAIPRSDWHYFEGTPDEWRGRDIVVRGWISQWRDKLRMRIGHPAMIEVLN